MSEHSVSGWHDSMAGKNPTMRIGGSPPTNVWDATTPAVVPDAQQATTPANPTDQIAAVSAYDWGYDDSDGTDETCFVLGRKTDRGFEILAQVYGDGGKHLAAYIERLEAEYPCKGVMDCARCEHRIPPDDCSVLIINARHKAERDALLAEHEAVGEGYGDETADVGCDCLSCRIIRAYDNAERVIRAANS